MPTSDKDVTTKRAAVIQRRIAEAQAKVNATIEALNSQHLTLEGAATALELEARYWAQDFHHELLKIEAMEGLNPEEFHARAIRSAGEIASMAANEFSVWTGPPTTDGRTAALFGRKPAVVHPGASSAIDTRGSILEYLKGALADYPQQYSRQSGAIYALTHPQDGVDTGEKEIPESHSPDDRRAPVQTIREASPQFSSLKALFKCLRCALFPDKQKTVAGGDWCVRHLNLFAEEQVTITLNDVYDYVGGRWRKLGSEKRKAIRRALLKDVEDLQITLSEDLKEWEKNAPTDFK